MRPSEDCVELLKRLEGFRAKPYRCAGWVWTVGYGSTAYSDGRRVAEGDQDLSREDAEALLRGTVGRVWERVRGLVEVRLTQGQCDALTLLAYNIGAPALAGSTLLRKINAGDAAGAAAEFPKWNKAGGRVLAGLTKRRALERAMFEKG